MCHTFFSKGIGSLCLGLLLAAGSAVTGLSPAVAQGPPVSIDDQLAAGEFTLALQSANQLPAAQRDVAMRQISLVQSASGADFGALESASSIADQQTRNEAYQGLRNSFGSPSPRSAIREG